jgi:hypothetical protein
MRERREHEKKKKKKEGIKRSLGGETIAVDYVLYTHYLIVTMETIQTQARRNAIIEH